MFEKQNVSDENEEVGYVKLKNFFRASLARIGLFFRSNHLILRKRNRLAKFVSSLPLAKKKPTSESKHVMFIDQFGMDLEQIQTIQMGRDCDEVMVKVILQKNQIFSASNNQSKFRIRVCKRIVPTFQLNTKEANLFLLKNGICLGSIEICNKFSIKGVVFTVDNKDAYSLNLCSRFDVNQVLNELKEDVKSKPKLGKNKFMELLQGVFFHDEIAKPNSKLDIVYIVWSVDEWTSWKFQVGIQKACKTYSIDSKIKTHEFFIQDLDKVLKTNQVLQFVICHQVNSIVYYDTNNGDFYNFEWAP